MLWYDKLNNKDREKVLAFALGYLKGTSEKEPKNIKEKCEKAFAEKLLKHMEEIAKELKN